MSRSLGHAMSEYLYVCMSGWMRGGSGDSHTHVFRKS